MADELHDIMHLLILHRRLVGFEEHRNQWVQYPDTANSFCNAPTDKGRHLVGNMVKLLTLFATDAS